MNCKRKGMIETAQLLHQLKICCISPGDTNKSQSWPRDLHNLYMHSTLETQKATSNSHGDALSVVTQSSWNPCARVFAAWPAGLHCWKFDEMVVLRWEMNDIEPMLKFALSYLFCLETPLNHEPGGSVAKTRGLYQNSWWVRSGSRPRGMHLVSCSYTN